MSGVQEKLGLKGLRHWGFAGFWGFDRVRVIGVCGSSQRFRTLGVDGPRVLGV